MGVFRSFTVVGGFFLFLAAMLFGYDLYFIQDELLMVSRDDSIFSFNSVKNDTLLDNLAGSSQYANSLVMMPLSEAGLQLVFASLVNSGKLLVSEEHLTKEVIVEQAALDYKRIVSLSFPCEHNAMTFVAPFAVTTKQADVFWFLGLFNFNHQTGVMTQKDSVLIGTKVTVEQLQYQNDNPVPNRVSLTYREATEDPETLQNFTKTFMIDKYRISQR